MKFISRWFSEFTQDLLTATNSLHDKNVLPPQYQNSLVKQNLQKVVKTIDTHEETF